MPKGLAKFTSCPKCKWDIRCNALNRHIKVCDGTGIKSRQIKTKVHHPDNLICDKCGRAFTTKAGYSKHVRKTNPDGSCSHPPWKQPEKRIWTEEQKQHLSVKKKSFLKENPDKHPWKNKGKHISKPTEKLKEFLRSKGLIFIEEWTPLTDRMFSIDIAFPDIKLGLEVNGNQHYERDGSLKSYYQERHDLIEAAGWTLIELHYTSCFNEELLSKVLEIKEQPDYSEYFRIKQAKKNRPKSLGAGVLLTQRTDAKWEPYRKQVLDSGIDFSKIGWSHKLGEHLDVHQNTAKKWLRKYLPDLYKTAYRQKYEKGKIPSKKLPLGVTANLKAKAKWAPYIEEILTSQIDFSSKRWVSEVATILNLETKRINKWMRQYMPDFYEENCLKRSRL